MARLVRPSPIRSRMRRSCSVRPLRRSSSLEVPWPRSRSRTRVVAAGSRSDFAGGDLADGVEEVAAADGLQDVAGGARHDRVEEGLVVGVRGEHQAPDRVVPRADLAADLDPAAVRQPYVQDGDVGAGGGDAGQGLGGGARLADDLDVVLGRQHLVHAPAHHLMVVEQEYGDFSAFTHGSSLTHAVFPRPG